MIFGIRKFSYKKRISAMTKGRVTRSIKRLYNPLYGKRGMGVINNPKKALYNRIYSRTTISTENAVRGNFNLVKGFCFLIFLPISLPIFLIKRSKKASK